MNLQICYLKIDVSCEASVNFHHISQNATPATNLRLVATVADDGGRLGNVERTHPQPLDPQSETGTLATHSGKRAWQRDLIFIECLES